MQSDNCAIRDNVCKQVGNVTACETEAGPMPEPKTDCGDTEKQACEEESKVCVIFGGVVRCVSKTPEAQCTEGATECEAVVRLYVKTQECACFPSESARIAFFMPCV